MLISIIDDEKVLTHKISKKLQTHGFQVHEYFRYDDFISYVQKENVSDLYIVDISLWKENESWFEIIKFLRNELNLKVPIIIISWFADIQTKLHWFNLGIDDYVIKPFSPEELVARVKAILRRPLQLKEHIIYYKNLSVNIDLQKIYMDQKEIILWKKEKSMLIHFIQNPEQMIPKNTLIHMFWWAQWFLDVQDGSIHTNISRIRKKITPDFHILNIAWIGYLLKKSD